MIYIRLKGGLGNQMFQYAFAKGMASQLKTEVRIDCSLLLDRARQEQVVYRDFDLEIFDTQFNHEVNPSLLRVLFKLRFGRVGKLIRSFILRGKHYEKEKHFHVDHELLKKPLDNTVYEGWWQSEIYWKNVADDIRKEFAFKEPVLPISLKIFEKIKKSNSICLNVRRTDFVNNPTLNATNLDYFLNSAQKMCELVSDPRFFIFSDDIEWCKEHLVLDAPTEIVDHRHKGDRFGNYLNLMTQCKHFIIPNSSFVWWAVWLCTGKEKKVIAPKKWFNEGDYNTEDLVPADWIRM